jgi:SAM-dependent methyltransferase
MATQDVPPARAAWRRGDYHRFAKEQLWEVGPVLVAACNISRGQRVLDVAAGTGNVAIRAAEAGAHVVASGHYARALRGWTPGSRGMRCRSRVGRGRRRGAPICERRVRRRYLVIRRDVRS